MSSIRTFLITVAVSAVLFGICAFYATGYVLELVYPDEELVVPPSDPSNDSPPDPSAQGTVNLLLVCTDQFFYRPSAGGAVESQFNPIADAELREHDTSILFLTLVSFNSTTRQVMVTALPGNTLVSASGQLVDLDTAYYFTQKGLYDLGDDFFERSISALLGLQIDYTGYVDIDDYIDVADNLGGITVNCPEAIPEFGFEEGNRLVSSGQLSRLLRRDYKDPAAKTALIASQCQAILSKITDPARKDNVHADFDRISKVLRTDFDKAALARYMDLFFRYGELNLQMPTAIGTYITSGEDLYFKPDRSATQHLFKQFK